MYSDPIPRADVVTWMLWLCSQVPFLISFACMSLDFCTTPGCLNISRDFSWISSEKLICASLAASTRQFGAIQLSAFAISASTL